MSDPAVHIAAWEAEGLIDAPLALRLRQSIERNDGDTRMTAVEPAAATGVSARAGRSPTSLGSFLGPTVTIGEMFGYLGVAFLLGAWTAFIVRIAGTTDRDAILTAGTGGAAIAMAALGRFLMNGDDRRRRAAGAAFLVAIVLVAGAAEFLVQLMSLHGPVTGIVVGLLAVAAAVVLRLGLPAVTTQLGLIGTLTGLAVAVMGWLQAVFVGEFDGGGFTTEPTFAAAEPVTFVLLSAGLWLVVALGLGLLGLFEARTGRTDAAAARRAALTRFYAGLVGVIGLATAVTRNGSLGNGEYGRTLEPWIGDLALLVFAAVLVERAFRRNANAFIVAAGLALIVALTDFNFSYLSQSTDLGLLIEGAILLAVGFAGDRLRRRLDRSGRDAIDPAAEDPGEPGTAPA
jgi:hypothetical protein